MPRAFASRVLLATLCWCCARCCAAEEAPPEANPTKAGAPVLNHIMVIWGENEDQTDARAEAYLGALADTYPEFTLYNGLVHPSNPNYLALTSGATQITANQTTCIDLNVTNIVDRLEGAGLDWRCYNEGMGADPCTNVGRYVLKHNFMIAYSNVKGNPARRAKVRGFTSTVRSTYSELLGENPPAVVFVAPDLCNDGHDCGVATFSEWLSGKNDDLFFQDMLSSKYYTDGAIFISFDEDDSIHGNHVYCVAVSALGKSGYKDARALDHYDCLRTIEDNFGLATMTANDAAAENMLGAFNPSPPQLSDGWAVR